ncbi:hypothetical protein T12_8501 [Trichinella patagoniensis]|uniref:Uncharacterized protein n=1 Tax=Trichinella patagoniensis TaxID=990121 RepID=A0A0V0Z7V5_9BILA|nr:hypothetical protein T12_8501 [Trichinella patagoniensis]
MDQGKRSHAFHRMKRVGQECLKFPSFSLEPHQPQQYWRGGLTSWQCRKTAKVEENAKKKRINYSKFRRAESEKKTPPHRRNQVKRVIVTPAVYPRLIEFLHFDIQSTGRCTANFFSTFPTPISDHLWCTLSCDDVRFEKMSFL